MRQGKAVLHVAQPSEQLHVPLLRHTPFSLHGVEAPPGQTPLQSVPKYPGWKTSQRNQTRKRQPYIARALAVGAYTLVGARGRAGAAGRVGLDEDEVSVLQRVDAGRIGDIVAALVVVPLPLAIGGHEDDRVGGDLDEAPCGRRVRGIRACREEIAGNRVPALRKR